MQTSICVQHCPAPFCLAACPARAIVSVSSEDGSRVIYLDTKKCNGCGICRVACMTWSRDKALERKRPWAYRKPERDSKQAS